MPFENIQKKSNKAHGIQKEIVNRKDRQHLDLLCSIGDLAAVLTGSNNIENFLRQTVELVSRHMDADVCSIYLLDEATEELVLVATVGLNPTAVKRVRMKIGDGLVGAVLENLAPLNDGLAGRNPRFKYFEEADEDRFNSFLGVPILRGVEKIGVLVVQHEKRDYFDDVDVIAMRAIASQLAGAVGNARFIMDLNRTRDGRRKQNSFKNRVRFVKGVAVSSGYALAPSTLLNKNQVGWRDVDFSADQDFTLNDFYRARNATVDQIKEMQIRFSQRLPESASLIFTAHIMILKDVRFVEEIEKRIEQGIPVTKAIRLVAEHYVALFSSSSHPLIREKAHDVEDLCNRLLANIRNPNHEQPVSSNDRIVIATKLYPSDVLKIASESVKGIILVGGGVASHVAILARSLQIPMVIADRTKLLSIPDGTPVFLDAEIGNVYVKPSERIVKQFKSQKEAQPDMESMAETMEPATRTLDGTRIRLLANINLLRDLLLARQLKAEGVGLYRSEFPYLIRSSIPSEEEQYRVYRRLFEEMPGELATIRTLDLGGDKLLAYSEVARESNPDLGLKAIRFSLRHPDIFRQQLQAILRAAVDISDLRIMFPMISSLDEFREAKNTVHDCLANLRNKKFLHNKKPLIGAMIEVPSVLAIIEDLAAEADFLSIGTNDFVQYMLAADRSNNTVADYYQPWHPAVLRGLAKIASAAQQVGKELSVCGELAHEIDYIPFLLGIGIRVFSVYPKFLPLVQKEVAKLKIRDVEIFADELLGQSTIKGVCEVLAKRKAN
jgi:phosphotransferase system enzyme I (PtsP)